MSKSGANLEVVIETMHPPSPTPNSLRPTADSQQDFLRLFLGAEREVRNTIARMVPSLADADDLLQQTALELWQKFDQFDPSLPFTPWACRFARNKTLQWLERSSRWRRLLQNGLAEELESRREDLRLLSHARSRDLQSDDNLNTFPIQSLLRSDQTRNRRLRHL